MNNPFATIDARLSNIETLLLDIKHDILGKQKEDNINKIPLIKDVEFSVRILNVLLDLDNYKLDYYNSTLLDLSQVSKDYIRRQRNIGRKSMIEIESVLKQYNLSLKP